MIIVITVIMNVQKGSASVLTFCVSKASSKGLQMIPDVFVAVSSCNTL